MKKTFKALALMVFTLLTATIMALGASASAAIPGDVNGNGKVSVLDSVWLLQYLAGADVSCDYNAMDVNGDKIINKQDVSALVKFIVGIKKEANIEPACAHISLAHTPATVTCTAAGTKEYWQCPVCHIKFGDAQATVAVTDRYLSAKAEGHKEAAIPAVDPTCTATGLAEGKQCSVCKAIITPQQTVEVSQNHRYVDNFCADCDKIEPGFSFPTGYITAEPIEIETEYCIVKVEKNIYVVDGVAEKIDIVCRALETVTGLKFNNDTYGKDKVVINVTHGTGPQGASGEDEVPFTETTNVATREINLAPRSLFIHHSRALVHELAHALHFSQTKWSHDDMLIEGFATYVTHLTLQYLAKDHADILYSLTIPNYEIYCFEIYTDELYKENIEYWFETPFTYMPHYHVDYDDYAIGFRIMWYLDEVYDDFTKWILYRERTDPSANHQYILLGLTEQLTEIKQMYGAEVFDGFYPWLKDNESIFYDPSPEAFDLTGLKYVSLYPVFDYRSNYTDLGKVMFNDLFLNVDEIRKYLREYKGKYTKYLRFGQSGDETVLISYYDKDGNKLKETKDRMVWMDDQVSYIKLNGSGTIVNLGIIGMADYEENGLAYKADFPVEGSPHYDLHFIYDHHGSHLIVPSSVNGMPVKEIIVYNEYDGTWGEETNIITEITLSEGVEEIAWGALRYCENVKRFNFPSTLKLIDGWALSGENVDIYYSGTLAEWEAISKHESWDTPKILKGYTLHCTDGNIVKEYQE